MNRRAKAVAALAAGLLSVTAMAEAAEDDAGIWLILGASDRLATAAGDSRWRYAIDAQARYFDVGSGANQLLLRPSVAYDFDERWSARAGYARFRTHPRSGPTVTEDRLWQQLSFRNAVSKVASLGVRFRLEQRFLSIGDDTGLVARLQLAYARPLVAGGGTELVASVEPFFDLADTDYGATTGLSQNRVYLGLRWPLTGEVSVAVGYLNQRFFRDGAEDLENHLAIVGLRARF